MTWDDLKRIFLSPTLFRLDTILAPKLVPLLYVTGLMALLLWAVTHLFQTFSRNFGDGLWGLLEIVVFGLLWLVTLRVVCEVLLVFFKTHETATRTVSLSRLPSTLMDEVRDAISDIADEVDEPEDVPGATPPSDAEVVPDVTPTPGIRRTARRTPPVKE